MIAFYSTFHYCCMRMVWFISKAVPFTKFLRKYRHKFFIQYYVDFTKLSNFKLCDFTKFWGFYKSLPDVLYKQQHSEYQLLKVVWPFSFAISLRMVMIYWKRLRKVLDVLRHHHWSIKIFQVFRNLQKPDQTSKIRFYTIWTINLELDSKFVIEFLWFVYILLILFRF